MDVEVFQFRKCLLQILRDISQAKTVTFDLEMSGISTKPKSGPGERAYDAGKPTLQQQYEEMKYAAETYQVLQMGITCVSEDQEKGYYLAKPWNFTLSPLLTEGSGVGQSGLKLNRDFTFSSSASEFLARNGFDFGKVFRDGVPYLSRDEEMELLEEFKQREDKKANLPDVIIASDDHKNLSFLRSARKTVTAWLNDPKAADDFINVADRSGPLTGLQRRLVHQVIRKEFPTLRAFALNDGAFMQVKKIDAIQEQAVMNRRLAGFKINLARQTGLRWVFEALCGGDCSGIDSYWFTRDLDQQEATAIEQEFQTIIQTLKDKKHMIVGHNLFFDLGFLYKTFIGVLPHDVRHFQEDIHELFPFIVDTKYLATHSPHHLPRSGLKDLLEPFKNLHIPIIVLKDDHMSYSNGYGRDHEAGYDSWMTAELFIKLAAQLYSNTDDIPDSASDSESDTPLSSSSDKFSPNSSSCLHEHRESNGGVKIKAKTEEDLIDLDLDAVDLDDGFDEEAGKTKTNQWLPKMSNRFWAKYVNKLRVNSSEEGVCDLAERDEDPNEGDVRRQL